MPQRTGAKTFSTRFLPSDGIPEYNALLDEHLGKRREYLLGNKKSLELLQQTGVVARVERHGDRPNQYVVHVAGSNQHSHGLRRKRPPSLPISSTSDSRDHEALWQALPPYGSTSGFALRNSATAPDLGVADRTNAMRIREEEGKEHVQDAERGEEEHQDDKADLVKEMEMESKAVAQWQPQQDSADRVPGATSTMSSRVAALKNLGRSRSTMALGRKPSALPLPRVSEQQQTDVGTNAGLSMLSEVSSTRHRSRSVIATPPTPLGTSFDPPTASKDSRKLSGLNSRDARAKSVAMSTASSSGKTTVEHLLESDAAFASQIRVMKEQLADLTAEKAHLDAEIAKVRRKLKGVNAVHENDVAVAHCAAIMQQRLAKAEEEYMKLVTAQQQAKTAVDRVRRELLSLKAVKRKLETDIDDVQRSNAAIEDKIHATKLVRNALSEELASLERQAEQELEEQKISLPPEDNVVVDVARLLNAATSGRQLSSSGSDDPLAFAMGTPSLSPSRAEGPRSSSKKDLRRQSVDYVATFKQVQQTLGPFSDAEDFAQAFRKTEEQLLAKYRATLALKDEVAALEKEQAALAQARVARHVIVRGSMQAASNVEILMQQKLNALRSRIASYNEMREARNEEHSRLRSVMLRCLEILQAESMLASFAQTLQPTRAVTPVPSSSSLLSSSGSSSGLTTPSGGATSHGAGSSSSSARPLLLGDLPSFVMLEALQKKMTEVAMALKVKHSARITESPEACYHRDSGKGGRRSNMFSTREVSKIVLGPRDPPGSTLAAIMESAQPPSVETALAMTEAGTNSGDTDGRSGGGSVVYPVGTIVITEKKAIEGSSSRSQSLNRAARRKKTSFGQ